jgi:hypothetical protein
VLKITHPSVAALLILDKRALKDIPLPKSKSLDLAPMAISSDSWEVQNYVNLRLTDAQCSNGFLPRGEHNSEVNIDAKAAVAEILAGSAPSWRSVFSVPFGQQAISDWLFCFFCLRLPRVDLRPRRRAPLVRGAPMIPQDQ